MNEQVQPNASAGSTGPTPGDLPSEPKGDGTSSKAKPKGGAKAARDAGQDFVGATLIPIPGHAELPRDQRGRVLGVWHATSVPDDVIDTRLLGASLEGDLVDRAVSLGCVVAPGPAKKRR